MIRHLLPRGKQDTQREREGQSWWEREGGRERSEGGRSTRDSSQREQAPKKGSGRGTGVMINQSRLTRLPRKRGRPWNVNKDCPK